MEGIERLPKWAQREIERLERRVADAEMIAEEALLATDPDQTDTYVSPMYPKKIGLPSGERVCFRLGEGYEIEVRVKMEGGGRMVELSSGQGRLVIVPQVSNVIRVGVGR